MIAMKTASRKGTRMSALTRMPATTTTKAAMLMRMLEGEALIEALDMGGFCSMGPRADTAPDAALDGGGR